MPASTKTTISACTQSQKRGTSTPGVLLDYRLAQRDRHGMRARVRLELRDHALRVRLHGLDAEADPARDLLGVEALRQQLEDLALALGQRLLGRRRPASAAPARATGPRTPCPRPPCGSRAAGPRAASPSSRTRARRRRSRPTAGACRRTRRRSTNLMSGAVWWIALHRGHAVDARQPHVHQHDLGLQPLHRLERVLAVRDLSRRAPGRRDRRTAGRAPGGRRCGRRRPGSVCVWPSRQPSYARGAPRQLQARTRI